MILILTAGILLLPTYQTSVVAFQQQKYYKSMFHYQQHSISGVGIMIMYRNTGNSQYYSNYYHPTTTSVQPCYYKNTVLRVKTKLQQKQDNDSNDQQLKKYKNRNNILYYELKSKTKEMTKQNSKLILLQDVVQKMKVSNNALMEKLALLRNELENKEQEDESTTSIAELLQNEINKVQEQLQVEQGKTKSIQTRCETLQMELGKVLQDHTKEIQTYVQQSNTSQTQIKEMNTVIHDLKDKLGKNNEIDVENQNLKKECSNLKNQIQFLSTKPKQKIEKDDYDLQKMYQRLKKDTGEILKEEIIQSSSLKAQIYNLERDRTKIETILDETKKELTMLQQQQQQQETNETMTQSPTTTQQQQQQISNEAIEIAKAAVQQSEEREEALRQQLNTISNTVETLTKERNVLQHDLVEIKRQYTTERDEREAKHSKQVQNLVTSLEKIVTNYTTLQLQHKNDQATTATNWETRLSTMEDEYSSVIECLKQEITLMNETVVEQSNVVVKKKQRLRNFWRRWFQKKKEGLE